MRRTSNTAVLEIRHVKSMVAAQQALPKVRSAQSTDPPADDSVASVPFMRPLLDRICRGCLSLHAR